MTRIVDEYINSMQDTIPLNAKYIYKNKIIDKYILIQYHLAHTP